MNVNDIFSTVETSSIIGIDSNTRHNHPMIDSFEKKMIFLDGAIKIDDISKNIYSRVKNTYILRGK